VENRGENEHFSAVSVPFIRYFKETGVKSGSGIMAFLTSKRDKSPLVFILGMKPEPILMLFALLKNNYFTYDLPGGQFRGQRVI